MPIKFLKSTTNRAGVLKSDFYKNDRRFTIENAYRKIKDIYMDYINQGLECAIILDYGDRKISSIFSDSDLVFGARYDEFPSIEDSKIFSFVIKIKT